MPKIVVLLVFLWSICPALSSAQTATDYRGAVLDKDTRIRLSGANIINTRTKTLRQSDIQGIFTIPAQIGDTLTVTKADYGELHYVVQDNADLVLYLTKSIRLGEVNVYGQSKRSEMEEAMDAFRKKGTFYNGKPPALSFLASPITGLYELFGKTPKNARRFQAYMHRELEAEVVDKKFNKTLVVSVTKLSGDDLVNFMDLYRPTFAEAKTWNEYDARVYIEQSFKNFEERGRPQAPKLVPLQP